MSLTDTAIRAAKPAEKQQKLFDAKGLYLLITPGGTKSWRLKYHFQGKEKLISLGTYPATSLKEAREKAADARKAIENGISGRKTPALGPRPESFGTRRRAAGCRRHINIYIDFMRNTC